MIKITTAHVNYQHATCFGRDDIAVSYIQTPWTAEVFPNELYRTKKFYPND